MYNDHYTIIKNGLYTLKTKNETITGRSYLDCLVKLIKKPIPIKYAANRAGFGAGPNRLPLCDPDEEFVSTFNPVMEEYEVDLPIS